MTDERNLVLKVMNGDMQAFNLLIKRHERLVAHMVGRVVKDKEACEELCQDVFLKVYDKLGDFNFDSRLSTWIGTIAYRLSINYARKKKLLLESPEMAEEKLKKYYVNHQTPETVTMEKDMSAFLQREIDLLPLQYKMVLLLYHMEEMTYPEIVTITGHPEGTVKNYLFRARKLLKERLNGYKTSEIF